MTVWNGNERKCQHTSEQSLYLLTEKCWLRDTTNIEYPWQCQMIRTKYLNGMKSSGKNFIHRTILAPPRGESWDRQMQKIERVEWFNWKLVCSRCWKVSQVTINSLNLSLFLSCAVLCTIHLRSIYAKSSIGIMQSVIFGRYSKWCMLSVDHGSYCQHMCCIGRAARRNDYLRISRERKKKRDGGVFHSCLSLWCLSVIECSHLDCDPLNAMFSSLQCVCRNVQCSVTLYQSARVNQIYCPLAIHPYNQQYLFFSFSFQIKYISSHVNCIPV